MTCGMDRWPSIPDRVPGFSIIPRPYEGSARIDRRAFQGLLDQRPQERRIVWPSTIASPAANVSIPDTHNSAG
jgi:hypothetical protein